MHQSVLGLFSSCSPVLITCGNGHKEKECQNQKNTEEICRTRSPAAEPVCRGTVLQEAGEPRLPSLCQQHVGSFQRGSIPSAPRKGTSHLWKWSPNHLVLYRYIAVLAQSGVTPDGARHTDVILGLPRGQAAHGSSTEIPCCKACPCPLCKSTTYSLLSFLFLTPESRKQTAEVRSLINTVRFS